MLALCSLDLNPDPAINCHPGVSQVGWFINVCAVPPMVVCQHSLMDLHSAVVFLHSAAPPHHVLTAVRKQSPKQHPGVHDSEALYYWWYIFFFNPAVVWKSLLVGRFNGSCFMLGRWWKNASKMVVGVMVVRPRGCEHGLFEFCTRRFIGTLKREIIFLKNTMTGTGASDACWRSGRARINKTSCLKCRSNVMRNN